MRECVIVSPLRSSVSVLLCATLYRCQNHGICYHKSTVYMYTGLGALFVLSILIVLYPLLLGSSEELCLLVGGVESH